jgi:hypothetical protein
MKRVVVLLFVLPWLCFSQEGVTQGILDLLPKGDAGAEPASFELPNWNGAGSAQWLHWTGEAWVLTSEVGVTNASAVSCPTDIDGDGLTGVSDVLLLLGEFGNVCAAVCPDQFMLNGVCYEQYFVGLDVADEDIEQYLLNMERFEENLSGLMYNYRSPLWTLADNGEWNIYFHVESWNGPLTALAVSNLVADYEEFANDWLVGLSDYDASAPAQATVRVFGFAFNSGVQLDATFYDVYGDYPIVTNWTETNETAPWHVVRREDNSEFGNGQGDFPWYTEYDFDDLKVVGNRTDVASGVTFSPADWSGYQHPEGIDHFYTKFWHKVSWDAVAQRQYLKIGGVISDYGTGANFNSVFTHEMGHCFFHDDIYDPIKYPDGAGLVSVMNGASEISNFDRVIQRMLWEAQKNQ